MPPILSGFSVGPGPAHSRQPRARPWRGPPCPARRSGGTLRGVGDPARLVVVSCASRAEAERALGALGGLKAHLLDAAVVTRSESGRVELRQTNQVAAGEGVVAGGDVGVVAGIAIGTAAGRGRGVISL